MLKLPELSDATGSSVQLSLAMPSPGSKTIRCDSGQVTVGFSSSEKIINKQSERQIFIPTSAGYVPHCKQKPEIALTAIWPPKIGQR